MSPGMYDESSREKMEYKNQHEECKRLAEENREKEMDKKQQKLYMEHEPHKAAMEAQQASQQVNMKNVIFFGNAYYEIYGR